MREACTGGSEGLEAYDHSRSMATGTGPDVRKWRGRQHAEQATHAIRHCNQNTLAGKLKGIQGGDEVGKWTRVTNGGPFCAGQVRAGEHR